MKKTQEIHWVSDVDLKPTEDSFEVVMPKSPCEIVQLARYSDSGSGGTVIINADLVAEMDTLNKAALYVHEAFYADIRRYGGDKKFASNSSRDWTGCQWLSISRSIGVYVGPASNGLFFKIKT
ncbi:MAG: hypothetical protein V9E84_05760 [Trichococcus flocculiformis]